MSRYRKDRDVLRGQLEDRHFELATSELLLEYQEAALDRSRQALAEMRAIVGHTSIQELLHAAAGGPAALRAMRADLVVRRQRLVTLLSNRAAALSEAAHWARQVEASGAVRAAGFEGLKAALREAGHAELLPAVDASESRDADLRHEVHESLCDVDELSAMDLESTLRWADKMIDAVDMFQRLATRRRISSPPYSRAAPS